MKFADLPRLGRFVAYSAVMLLGAAPFGCSQGKVTPVGGSLEEDLSDSPSLNAHQDYMEQEGITGGMEMEDGSRPPSRP